MKGVWNISGNNMTVEMFRGYIQMYLYLEFITWAKEVGSTLSP
jgi:hypothetical protein